MKNMKNILLLGDSIRQNYQEYVKNNMCQFANVYYPNDNGRFCSYTLRYLHEWIDMLSRHSRIEFDIVHFNCGLWDVLRLANDEIFTSETEYEKLLKRIVYRIKYLCPKAKIVFALTTEVIEPGFTPGINIGQRKNDDIRRYNEIAKKVCAELQIDVNDLWSLSVSLPAEAHSDDVHFETEAGIQALGNQVVCFLKKYCDEKTAKNKIKKFIDIYIPTELCNFRCTYCYLSQRDEKVSGKIEKITHTPQEIREALSLERMGGVCLLNLCAGGETLFGEDILPVIKELVLEGHYVSVITNGTMTKRFEEITRWDKAICEKIFFKFSFHYLELKKRNMFDVFFANIYRVREAGCSVSVELMPHDELVPYIDEIKEISLNNLKALPHVTVGRDEGTSELRLLTDYDKETYDKIWNTFDSEMFDFKLKMFGEKITDFCHAGEWSCAINLNTGVISQCHGAKVIGNLWDTDMPIKFEAVGKNCPLPHCFNCHVFATLGLIPDKVTPTYAVTRDRKCSDGTYWLSDTFKYIFSQRLYDNNVWNIVDDNIMNDMKSELENKIDVITKQNEELHNELMEYKSWVANLQEQNKEIEVYKDWVANLQEQNKEIEVYKDWVANLQEQLERLQQNTQ